MNEVEALVVLNAIPGATNLRIRKLVHHFGSGQKVLAASEDALVSSGIVSASTAGKIKDFPQDDFLKNEYNIINSSNIKILDYNNAQYPANLAEIPDAPVILYTKGKTDFNRHPAIAIIGSRKASFYGTSMAERFARELARLGICVVSGLARGIDTAAHRGAIKSKGITVAVLGCGLAHMYPPENEELFNDIVASGAVISEFPLWTAPIGHNFPRRNRIISGLSLGVVVVEASKRSGALITSRFALEQGREVFAVPGKIDHPNAFGANDLIKQGAKLVSSVEDILEELTPHLKAHKDQAPVLPKLTVEEKELYRRIGTEAVHIDELIKTSGLGSAQISGLLLSLELKKLIKQLPGKMFVREGTSAW